MDIFNDTRQANRTRTCINRGKNFNQQKRKNKGEKIMEYVETINENIDQLESDLNEAETIDKVIEAIAVFSNSYSQYYSLPFEQADRVKSLLKNALELIR